MTNRNKRDEKRRACRGKKAWANYAEVEKAEGAETGWKARAKPEQNRKTREAGAKPRDG